MHNSLLLISLTENKAYSLPTVNTSDISPSFTFKPCLTHPEEFTFSGLLWRTPEFTCNFMEGGKEGSVHASCIMLKIVF